jgi:hypothetical protein
MRDANTCLENRVDVPDLPGPARVLFATAFRRPAPQRALGRVAIFEWTF